MKIREPIRLVIMYSDRLAIKRGRHSYISAWHVFSKKETKRQLKLLHISPVREDILFKSITVW